MNYSTDVVAEEVKFGESKNRDFAKDNKDTEQFWPVDDDDCPF